ncbi:hypothetical protein M2241_003296 [Bradyrhizobium elkanii]|nr:hypothetical protein [Bradyrhizobium elkanii]MCP1983362.1 hypothetical protein [Bradyrhizobium elkanii]MCS3881658.1 hypothetical protein [Bradyrhizobium elkanii]MCS4218416.1 hypothetical protein [Bradyrhizobium elkanii]MCW2194280.1 hypothetical protein [Bradyrhizobium elkanii]
MHTGQLLGMAYFAAAIAANVIAVCLY